MANRISQIYQGWKNHISPSDYLRDVIRETQEKRLAICSVCPHHSKNHFTPLRPDAHCTLCGCTLTAKTACLSCKCPDDVPRWESVLTKDEQEKISENGNDI